MLLLTLVLALSPAAESLKRAEAYYTEAQYADAVAALDELYARRDLSVDERRETTIFLGMAHLALGHEEAARARFREVLESDDKYVLPRYTSPKIRTLFDHVRAEVRGSPVLVALPPETSPTAVGPEHVELRFRAERLGEGQAVAHWRRAGERSWAQAELHPPKLALEPPLGLSEGQADFDLEYFAEVREPDGRVLAHAGSAEQPMTLHVRVRAPDAAPAHPTTTPIYKRWWFWTAVGVAAAGASVAAYAATRSEPTTGALDLHFGGP